MRISQAFPDIDVLRSDLPPGGDPRIDRAYSIWIREFLDEQAPRVLDRLADEFGNPLPGARKVERHLNQFSITGHLFKWLIGWNFPSGTGPTFQHRMRFVAVQLHLRRAELVAEAEAYLDRIIEELRQS